MTATIVELGKLANVVLTSVAAGVGVSTLFAVAVFGATRAGERRSSGLAATVLYGALALIGLAGCLFAVVYGVLLLSQK